MISILGLLATGMVYAQDNKYPGFTKTASGLYYKMLVINTDARKPEIGDIVTFSMVNKNSKDSIIYNSGDDIFSQNQPLHFPMEKPVYKGDFIEGVALMGVGDSAAFITSADSFFLKLAQFKELPPFIEPGSDLTFYVRLLHVQTKADYEKELKEKNKGYYEKLEKLKNEEPGKIKKYIDSNKIKVKPTASGLYYIETKKGSGPKAGSGDTVTVHYTGKFIDGTVFDSSVGRIPVKFPLGAGVMIKGWEEGIALMKKGSKGTLLIPSSLAYGEKGGGNLIPPYCPLIFDVEIVDIVKAPKKK